MIFLIKGKKCDTEKSEMIFIKRILFLYTEKIFKTKKGNYFVFEKFLGIIMYYNVLSEEEVKEIIIRNSLKRYVELFGEIEEW